MRRDRNLLRRAEPAEFGCAGRSRAAAHRRFRSGLARSRQQREHASAARRGQRQALRSDVWRGRCARPTRNFRLELSPHLDLAIEPALREVTPPHAEATLIRAQGEMQSILNWRRSAGRRASGRTPDSFAARISSRRTPGGCCSATKRACGPGVRADAPAEKIKPARFARPRCLRLQLVGLRPRGAVQRKGQPLRLRRAHVYDGICPGARSGGLNVSARVMISAPNRAARLWRRWELPGGARTAAGNNDCIARRAQFHGGGVNHSASPMGELRSTHGVEFLGSIEPVLNVHPIDLCRGERPRPGKFGSIS